VPLKTKLDDKDLIILQVLAEDARTSHVAIAKVAGLSEGAVRGRLDWLQANGILLGFRAIINAELVSPHPIHLVAFDVSPGAAREALHRFEAALSALPGVLEIDRVDHMGYLVRIGHEAPAALLQAIAAGAGVPIAISAIRKVQRTVPVRPTPSHRPAPLPRWKDQRHPFASG
jgi:DNA-binding Lrp family transcriptional regulator